MEQACQLSRPHVAQDQCWKGRFWGYPCHRINFVPPTVSAADLLRGKTISCSVDWVFPIAGEPLTQGIAGTLFLSDTDSGIRNEIALAAGFALP